MTKDGRPLAEILAAYSAGGMTTHDIHGFVFREGAAFSLEPLTADERAIVATASKGVRLRAQACFENAQHVLLRDRTGRLVYVEGYLHFANGVRPTPHGWLAIGRKVVDPTPLPLDDDEAREYYGVRIARRYVLTTLAGRNGAAGTLLDDWQEGWPILLKGVAGWRYVEDA